MNHYRRNVDCPACGGTGASERARGDPACLEELRKARGWTYTEVARRARISVGTVRRVLVGERPVTTEIRGRVAIVLDEGCEACAAYVPAPATDPETIRACARSRRALGLTEHELAERAGLRVEVIRLFEAGKAGDLLTNQAVERITTTLGMGGDL